MLYLYNYEHLYSKYNWEWSWSGAVFSSWQQYVEDRPNLIVIS